MLGGVAAFCLAAAAVTWFGLVDWRRVGDWLAQLPAGVEPRQQDLHALGATPIGAGAGDLVIWHQALPHGPSPNRGTQPRLVQYINLAPAHVPCHDTWV